MISEIQGLRLFEDSDAWNPAFNGEKKEGWIYGICGYGFVILYYVHEPEKLYSVMITANPTDGKKTAHGLRGWMLRGLIEEWGVA